MKLSTCLLWAMAGSLAAAQKAGIRSHLALACWNTALKWDFECAAKENAVPCLCTNEPFLGTVLACIREKIEDEPSINHAYQHIQNNCKYNGKVMFSFGKLDDLYYHSRPYIVSPEQATELTKDKGSYLQNPVNTESDEFDIQFRAAYIAKRQYDLGTVFGGIILFYWLVVAIVGVSLNFIAEKYPEILFKNSPTANYIRKSLVLPATFKENHGRPVKLFMNMYMTAPTRGQSLILLGYFLLNVILVCVKYDLYSDNPYVPSVQLQTLKYLGTRTGIMSFTQIPLVILFASRNNIFIKLTGWSYDTMQVYHRWVARVMMIHALIHSVCYTGVGIFGNTVIYRWQEVINWRFGNMATYAGIFMVLMAINAFRARYYDVFYFFHKVFYVFFIVGISRHCWDFGWMGWVWASLSVHLLERGARVYNTILSGLHNEAHAELFDDNTFRVSVKYSKRWALGPGQYCYIRILHKNLFWQAHPFSVYSSPDEEDKNIQFAIKAQNGATKTIADYLSKQPNRSARLPVMIEGPYGHHAPIEKYDTIFLMAGGMGVTATYAYALHLKRLAKRGQKIVFLWIIQNTTPLEWFGEELLSLTGNPNIELQIYITRKFTARTFSGADSDEEIEDDIDEDLEKGFGVAADYSSNASGLTHTNSQRTLRGRPSLQKMLPSQRFQDQFGYCLYDKRPNIPEEVSKFLNGMNGNMAIVSCGPPILVDAIRKSIVENIEETEGRVDYFEEAFSW